MYNEFDNLFPQIKTNEFKNLLVPITNDLNKKNIENKVDQILTLKQDNPEADTTTLEKEIDAMVYALYDLTEEEIKIVEES